MYKTVQINSSNANDDKEIRELYETSFPDIERIPYDQLINLIGPMNIDFTAFYEGENFIGFWVVNRLKRLNYGLFLAVSEKLRGKGIGQKLITLMLDTYSKEEKPLLGEVESPSQLEAPNIDIRKRRYNFYMRNNVKDTGRSYIYKGVLYNILTTSSGPFTQEDFDEIADSFKRILESGDKNKESK